MSNVSEDALVQEWRLSQFERLGFSHSSAVLLNEWNVDLDDTRKLISRDCPPHLAMRILRPLEDRPAYAAAGVVKRVAEYSQA